MHEFYRSGKSFEIFSVFKEIYLVDGRCGYYIMHYATMSDTTVSPKLVQFTSKAADFVNHALCPHLYPHTCTLSFINASPRGHSHHSVQFPIIGKYDVREGFSDHGWATPGEHSGGHHQVIERARKIACSMKFQHDLYMYRYISYFLLTLLKCIFKLFSVTLIDLYFKKI